ncbi:aromatic acid exporter family protein [Streptomyces capparidis]
MRLWTTYGKEVLRSAPERLRRAVRHDGSERERAVWVVKTVVAVVAAWWVASSLLPHPVTTFAPFTALLAMQATVYRSVRQALRYGAAAAVGMTLAAAFGTAAGVHPWSLAVLTVCALAASRLPVYGSQRLQVLVTSLFAFNSGGGEPHYVLRLVAAVGIGLGCGLAVNVLLPPPTRYRSAREAVAELSSSVCGLLHDIASTLRDGAPGEDRTREWARRARRVEKVARRARRTVADGEESARLNPRRVFRGGDRTLPEHHRRIGTLERVGFQAQSIVRGLTYAANDADWAALAEDFLVPYADLLADAARAFSDGDGDGDGRDAGERDGAEPGDAVRAGRDRYRELTARARHRELTAPDEWPLYGTLLTDAYRILEELDRPAAGRRHASSPVG